jgi:transcriptional regulator with XRE-family HTH domain
MANLSTYLAENGIKEPDFARRLNVAQSTVWRLARGKVRPSLDLATLIERETGGEVKATSWAAS